MRYTVVWMETATNDLARIWMQGVSERRAITDASNEIDRRLAIDPDRVGHAFGASRSVAIAPLLVFFEVLPDDRLARVLSVLYVP